MSPGRPPSIDSVQATAYSVPTPAPEADGTLSWDATTIVLAEARAGPVSGLGWTYADAACVPLIEGRLAAQVAGRPVLDVPAAWTAMRREIRNLGRPGLVSCAMSAVDVALWDAAARWLGVPVAGLLGRVHDRVDVYASGGFTSMSARSLIAQLEHWVHDRGIPRVKIKIGESWGTEVDRDLERVRLGRETAGENTAIYVDANGGYTVGQARRLIEPLRDQGVTWFEEPVSSDDLAGLSELRVPGGPDIAAGEYGYDLPYFARLVPVVDCLQIDVTRCGGFTEWRRAAAVAAAMGRDVSAHCAPNLSAHAGVATANFRHIEWFADHDRIEREFFESSLDPSGGTVSPDEAAPGLGLEFRRDAAARYRI
ncbi:enolase C-terminal domain-like protein [Amycolatopsis keratiniphila]|uniref:enolase C-terminal domain-like protein n=1 Tax=Amycolatopsis keratiniphila TaxID=129921 RepID=UPI0008794431|nr:enolase C-terminal domain-like protein [Amycolatopsis keratiniphila]OLZ58088.1 mandelate racemase [Amycolatopsis keratiniphila subsp. nogabecina]SDU43969.1 L-alanine-DL-glutamate epimerase [Amycolatopsis keratiniphila]